MPEIGKLDQNTVQGGDNFGGNNLWGNNLGDFLTPEQRLQAVAEILSTIALRALKHRHEEQNS